MNYVTQTALRNHRFRRAYLRERGQRLGECVERLVERVLGSPVKRGFFVSVDHAIVMDRRRREGKLPQMSKMRRLMWDEIFAALDEYRRLHPRATITDAACAVISSATASRFYISRSEAIRLAESI